MIIDGTGSEPKEDWDILVCNDQIVKLESDVDIPANAEVTDLSGFSVLPGLIDMHGHLYGNTGTHIGNQPAYLDLYLAGGVTTIYSPGEYDIESTLQLQREVELGQRPGPDVLTSGPYFDRAPSQLPWVEGIETLNQLRSQFDVWRDRINGIKIYTGITTLELDKLIKLADRYNLPVTGHLESLSAVEAIDLGIDGIEHGIFGMPEFFQHGYSEESIACRDAALDLTDHTIERLIDKIITNRVYITPTIVQYESMLPKFEPISVNWQIYIPEEFLVSVDRLRRRFFSMNELQTCIPRAFAKQAQLLREIQNRGGLIVAGTDPIHPIITPGYGIHREMKLLVEAGLTPMEAIQAATLNAAIALREDELYGSVEVGKRANFVVVEGNPLQNIEDIGNTVMVIKDGNSFNPSELRSPVIGQIGARSE